LEGSNQTKHATLPALQQMSDTPETKAAILASEGQWSFVLRECCEKLERERNQLREIVEQRLLAGAEIHQKAQDLLRRIQILEQERNQMWALEKATEEANK
jgi:hypothetical protein